MLNSLRRRPRRRPFTVSELFGYTIQVSNGISWEIFHSSLPYYVLHSSNMNEMGSGRNWVNIGANARSTGQRAIHLPRQQA